MSTVVVDMNPLEINLTMSAIFIIMANTRFIVAMCRC